VRDSNKFREENEKRRKIKTLAHDQKIIIIKMKNSDIVQQSLLKIRTAGKILNNTIIVNYYHDTNIIAKKTPI